jgi:hypothetical protein
MEKSSFFVLLEKYCNYLPQKKFFGRYCPADCRTINFINFIVLFYGIITVERTFMGFLSQN